MKSYLTKRLKSEELNFQEVRKIQPSEEGLLVPYPHNKPGSDGESAFFKGVVPGSLTILQRVAIDLVMQACNLNQSGAWGRRIEDTAW